MRIIQLSAFVGLALGQMEPSFETRLIPKTGTRGDDSLCAGKHNEAILPPQYNLSTAFVGFCCNQQYYDIACPESCACSPQSNITCYRWLSEDCSATGYVDDIGENGYCHVVDTTFGIRDIRINAALFCAHYGGPAQAVPIFEPKKAEQELVGEFKQIINSKGESTTGIVMTHAALIPQTSSVLLWNRGQKPDVKYQIEGTFAAIYDTETGEHEPSHVVSSPFCSGASYTEDGEIIVTGGEETTMPWGESWAPWAQEGVKSIRLYNKDKQWEDVEQEMANGRWYPTQLTVSDGRVVIVGGYHSMLGDVNKEVEILDPKSKTIVKKHESTQLSRELKDKNLYPYMQFLPPTPQDHLSHNEEHIFQFACNYGEIVKLDASNNIETVRVLPGLPENVCTHLSATGTGRLLALREGYNPEFISFGGANMEESVKKECWCDIPALANSYRLDLQNENAEWEIEDMPFARVGGTNILLPNGHVVLLNGGEKGFGNHMINKAVLTAVMYNPYAPKTERYKKLATSPIARNYHSNAVLMPTGNILIGGGDQGNCYSNAGNAEWCGSNFAYEYRAEEFLPPYAFAKGRFSNLKLQDNTTTEVKFGETVVVEYNGDATRLSGASFVAPSAVTHSTDMSGRVAFAPKFKINKPSGLRRGMNAVEITVPTAQSKWLAPGWHMVFLLQDNDAVVSDGSVWVNIISPDATTVIN